MRPKGQAQDFDELLDRRLPGRSTRAGRAADAQAIRDAQPNEHERSPRRAAKRRKAQPALNVTRAHAEAITTLHAIARLLQDDPPDVAERIRAVLADFGIGEIAPEPRLEHALEWARQRAGERRAAPSSRRRGRSD